MSRDLDGCYFRVERNGSWLDVCFSDLTENEQDSVLSGRSNEWLEGLIKHLCSRLEGIGLWVDIPDSQWDSIRSDNEVSKKICKSMGSTLRYWGDVLNLKGNQTV